MDSTPQDFKRAELIQTLMKQAPDIRGAEIARAMHHPHPVIYSWLNHGTLPREELGNFLTSFLQRPDCRNAALALVSDYYPQQPVQEIEQAYDKGELYLLSFPQLKDCNLEHDAQATLPVLLKTLRLAVRLKRTELAKLCGEQDPAINDSFLRKIEQENLLPSQAQLKVITDVIQKKLEGPHLLTNAPHELQRQWLTLCHDLLSKALANEAVDIYSEQKKIKDRLNDPKTRAGALLHLARMGIELVDNELKSSAREISIDNFTHALNNQLAKQDLKLRVTPDDVIAWEEGKKPIPQKIPKSEFTMPEFILLALEPNSESKERQWVMSEAFCTQFTEACDECETAFKKGFSIKPDSTQMGGTHQTPPGHNTPTKGKGRAA